MPIRKAIRYASRNKLLLAATALMMAGAGCVGAVRVTGEQLTEDALKPITVPIEAYGRAVEAASNVEALDRAQIEQAGGIGK